MRRHFICFKPSHKPEGDGISPRRHAVVKMIGGYVPQMRQRSGEKNGMVVEYADKKQPDYRILPSVEEQIDLVGLAADVPLVEIE